MSSVELFELLHTLLAKHNLTQEHLEDSLLCIVVYLDYDTEAKIKFRKWLKTRLSKHFSTCVHQMCFQASGGVDTGTDTALVAFDGTQTSKQDEQKPENYFFCTSTGRLTTWRLVAVACEMILALFSCWHEHQSLTIQHTDASGRHNISIDQTKLRLLLPLDDYKLAFDKPLQDAKDLREMETIVQSREFFLDYGNRVLLDKAPDQWDTLMLLRSILDQQELITNLRVGGTIKHTQDASTIKDLLALYSVTNSTAVSSLAWDTSKRPIEWRFVQDNYKKRSSNRLRRALQTIRMNFGAARMPPEVAAHAQKVTNLGTYINASSNTLNWRWVLIKNENNTDDIRELSAFILHTIRTLKHKTDISEFERRILYMAMFFHDVSEKLEHQSNHINAHTDAVHIWNLKDTKAEPISMLDLHNNKIMNILNDSPYGKRHNVFIYDMVSLQDQEFEMIDEPFTKTKSDAQMHILLELLLHSLSFPCTSDRHLALKPIFLGYTRSFLQQSWQTEELQNLPSMLRYVTFAECEHMLHQLIPQALPRLWKTVSYADVKAQIQMPGSNVLSITDFKENFASDTYELTETARKRLRTLPYFNGTYLHFTNDTGYAYFVAVQHENIDFELPSIFSAMVSILGPRLSFKALKDAFVDDLTMIKKLFVQMQILYNLQTKMITDSLEYNLDWFAAFSVLGSSIYLTRPWDFFMLLLNKILNVYEKATRKSHLLLRVFPYVVLFGCVFWYLFDKAKNGDGTRKLLGDLYKSLDKLKIINVVFNFFCLALEICQFFVINNGDSVSILSTFDDYIENEENTEKRKKIEQIFTTKQITEDCINTFNACAHDLDVRLDDELQNVCDMRTYANIVVGYCRVLSLRMMVMLFKHPGFGDREHSRSGTLNLLKDSREKLDEFCRKYPEFQHDDLLISFKRQTKSTVSYCLEYFQNAHDDAVYEYLKTKIVNLWQLVSQPVSNTKLDDEKKWHQILKYVSSGMMFFYCRNKSLLTLFVKFGSGNVEMQTQAQRLLYNSYKSQALLQHDNSWYQFVTSISAFVDFIYIGYLFDYCWSRSNASLYEQSRFVCKNEKHLKMSSDKYQNTFVHLMLQHLQRAERTSRRIAEIENEDRFGPARAGAHSAHRPPAPSVRNETLPHEEQHLHGSTPADDDGADSSDSEGRPDAAESGSSHLGTGDDSDSASVTATSKPTDIIIMDLRRLCLSSNTDVNKVHTQLRNILQSFQQDHKEQNTKQFELNNLFANMTTYKNFDGDSFDWSIAILTERVSNTYAPVNLMYLNECLKYTKTLKDKCTQTSEHDANLRKFRTAFSARIPEQIKCLQKNYKEECMKSLDELLIAKYKS
jgi:hypothetical protein